MRLFTIDINRGMFWYQTDVRSFRTGLVKSDTEKELLLNEMRSNGATMLDITNLPPKVQGRLIDKYFNGMGTTDVIEEYAEALKLNGAVEIK